MSSTELDNYLQKNFRHTSTFITGFSAFIIDIFVIFLCFGIGFFLVNLVSSNDIEFRSFINYSVFIPLMMIIFSLLGLYPGVMISPSEQIKKYAIGTLFSYGLIFLCIFYSYSKNLNFIKVIVSYTGDAQLLIAFTISFIFSLFFLPACRDLSRIFFSKFNWFGVPIVIYNTSESAKTIVEKLYYKKYLGYKPALIIDSDTTKTDFLDIPVFSDKDKDVFLLIKKHNIKNALICSYNGDLDLIMNSYRYTISVAKVQNSFTTTQHIKDIDGIVGFSSTHNLTFKFNLLVKRTLDILFILIFSPILIPVFLLLMIFTKLTSKGPIFYGHKRIGKNNKEFTCWKFRSMNIRSKEMLEEILRTDPQRKAEWEESRKFKNDPRITKFGKFLRKTSLDELPQLINILLGQMSFVGPRPVTASEIEKYGKFKKYVLSVSPGLSGMWQISGRSETSYEERIFYDSYYIQNWSVWLDIWILIRTFFVVLIGKGAY